jgi:hypothetical protein
MTLNTNATVVPDDDIENFLDLSPGTLDLISTGDATEGSALRELSIFLREKHLEPA